MRRLTRAIVAVALIGGAACSASPAAASTDEALAGTAIYAVDISDVSTGPEGESAEEAASGELRIACVGTDCAIVSEPARLLLGGAPFTTAETLVSQRESGQTGSPCVGGRGGRTVSIEATADGFSATLVQQPIDWQPCDDGTEAFGHAREVVWTGTVISADPCVFTDTGCVATATTTSQLASGNPAAPSVFSALATPAEAGTAPQQLITAVLLTIILVLLVAFPTSLLNSAVETGSERMSGWWAARRRREPEPIGPAIESIPAVDAVNAVDGEADATTRDADGHESAEQLAVTEPSSAPRLGRWWWAASGVVLAGLISAFVDPEFGFNPGSVRVVLSLLVSFAIDVALGWFLLIWVMRRLVPGATHTFLFRPATLLVVVAAVVFTRLTGFEPGIVFGLVAGVAFGALVGKAAEARGALVTLGYAFIVALAAWALYGVLGGGAATGQSFWSAFLIETLSAIAVGGMAALPIALFPVRGMAGYAIWSWRRWVWAACYALGLFAFFVVLMPMPFAWEGVAWDLTAWIGAYLVYAIGAVVAWVVIARPWHRDDESGTTTAEAPAEDAQPETVR
ncbi:hypothetical protein [Microbacterium pumilum]|uniref:Uncharacterized protein n=1 Tax=Microbacterium pumilum TaxID=344165 RepID=A0ABN2SJY1_9MICO